MNKWTTYLRYLAEETLDDWRRSPGVAVLATATLAAVLFTAGLVLLVLSNVSGGLEVWRGDARVEVYLHDAAGASDVEAVRRSLQAVPGVTRVAFVDKSEALRRFRAAYRGLGQLAKELEMNPLPASFEAYIGSNEVADVVAGSVSAAVKTSPAVEEVRFDGENLARVEAVLGVARRGGSGLAGLIAAASMFVMAAVMRLAVIARREEIGTMLLVGASPAFVHGPYLAAGLAQGLAAAAIALGLVETVRRLVLAAAGDQPTSALAFVAGSALPPVPSLAVLAAGAVVGVAGAWLAVRRVEE